MDSNLIFLAKGAIGGSVRACVVGRIKVYLLRAQLFWGSIGVRILQALVVSVI